MTTVSGGNVVMRPASLGLTRKTTFINGLSAHKLAGRISTGMAQDEFPQGLKPACLMGLFGAAEAAPLQNRV
jgi:hypothetical protein